MCLRQCVQGGDGRLGQAGVLLVIPDVLVFAAVDAEFFPKLEFEFRQPAGVVAAHVEQDDFGDGNSAGFLVDEFAAAVNDADIERLLDFAESAGQRGAEEIIEAAVEHFAAGPEALLAVGVAGPEGADEDVALGFFEIGFAGEQTVQHRADAADLLNRFVGYVNDNLHGMLHLNSPPRFSISPSGRMGENFSNDTGSDNKSPLGGPG